jgi:succinate dehydrogenase/fumarate reductase flavoprotein subunit
LAAAVAAAERSARVIVLEKQSATGGTGGMSMGSFGVEKDSALEEDASH